MDSSGQKTLINNYVSDHVGLASGGGKVIIGVNDTPVSKLEVRGDITATTHITASANISASGLLFISASQNAGQTYGVLVRDPATGRVYHTGSYSTGGTGGTGGGTATKVTLIATNATNATHYLTFTDADTGDENVRTDTSLTYNPSTNILTAGTFVGALSGNATSATSATSATTATKVTLTATNATNATHYLTFTDATTGDENVRTDTSLTYNPSTNILTATSFIGSLTGNASTATTATNANNATNATNINISATTSTDTSTSVVLVGAQSTGNQSPFIDSGLTYNANTNILDSTGGFKVNGSNIVAQGAGIGVSLASGISTISFNPGGDTNGLITSNGGTSGFTAETVNDLSFDTTSKVLRCGGDIVAFYASDKRLKDNIIPISSPLNKLLQIGGYEFDWNKKQKAHTGHDYGVIAQEIEKVLPQAVTTREDGYKAVKYEKIIPLLIESIKDQQKQINELKKSIAKLTK
jgi:hypothetical protein